MSASTQQSNKAVQPYSPGADRTHANGHRGGVDHMSFLRILDLIRCPDSGSKLYWDEKTKILSNDAGLTYLVSDGIPQLFLPNDWSPGQQDVTEIVKSFYEVTPFPNYDDLESRESLSRKAKRGVFADLLDEQIGQSKKVLEVGCGTGQLTNFLAMGWRRTVIGGDICQNSLKLAKDFRDRFSINNANFVQMNLFRLPFEPNTFDFAICNGVLHHTSDPEGGFGSICRLVKPGGFLLVGLYNSLGRLPTLWRRALIERFGASFAYLDHRFRGSKMNKGRESAWYMDQYRHPHESKHSISEVLDWFKSAEVDFISCIPQITGRNFDLTTKLFEPRNPGGKLDRLSAEIEMLLKGGADGAIFIMIGRKRL